MVRDIVTKRRYLGPVSYHEDDTAVKVCQEFKSNLLLSTLILLNIVHDRAESH